MSNILLLIITSRELMNSGNIKKISKFSLSLTALQGYISYLYI